MKRLAYPASDYLSDRLGILAEISRFISRYPGYSLEGTSFPSRLKAINKEYRDQFIKD